MKTNRYLRLFDVEKSRQKIKLMGIFRLITTIICGALLVFLVLAYSFRDGNSPLPFLIATLLCIVFYALNSAFEKIFCDTITRAIDNEANANIDDSISLIKKKCFSKYEKYAVYMKKSNKLIITISIIMALVVVTFGILTFALPNDDYVKGICFAITSIGILVYALIQAIYFIISLIKENEFFDSCKSEFSLLKKNA